jgi:dihydropteroate synthase
VSEQQVMIMGVLNITPDSFSDGGRFFDAESAIAQAQLMVEQGADIIDIGGESTRPGAPAVSAEDELGRVLPVIEALSGTIDVPISIDTSKPIVMQKAVEAGASIINDVYALQGEGALEMAGTLGASVCLMHMQGTPRTMQENPTYEDVVADVKAFFKERIAACASVGIKPEAITLDPGFGFGKNLGHNIALLKNLSEFHEFGVSILAGLSRKSMIGALLGDKKVNERMIGSVTAALVAVENGANIIRAHDVGETKDALTVWQQIKHFRE